MKRLIAAVTAMMLLFALTASGEETAKSGDYYYRVLEDGTAEITKYDNNERRPEIPSELDGYEVTRIGERAFNVR